MGEVNDHRIPDPTRMPRSELLAMRDRLAADERRLREAIRKAEAALATAHG
jgi:hypothetical protein